MIEPETLDPARIAHEMMLRADTSTRAFFGGSIGHNIAGLLVEAAKSPMALFLTIALDPTKYTREQVAQSVTRIYAALLVFAAPTSIAVSGPPIFGERFYKTPLGHALLKADVYGSDDELVPASDAAKRAKVSLSSLSQYVSRGTLAGYPDPVIPNRMFVRRNELERFITERKAKSRRKGRQGLASKKKV